MSTSSTSDALAAAFEHAVAQVDRAAAGGMLTAAGEPAAPRLARLRAELLAQRDLSRERGRVDAAWMRRTIREVAEWAPESDLTLLGALGALARLRADTGAG